MAIIAGRKLRLLLVEDSATDALLIEHEIRKGGFDVAVKHVRDAAEMRVALRSQTFDIVISDHNLPGSNSLDTLSTLREAEVDVPFLIVSGVIGEETAVAAMRAGASDYLLKDRLSRLVPVIERELGQAAQRKSGRAAEAQLEGAQAAALQVANERARVFEILHEVAAATGGILDVAKLADLTVQAASRLLGADDALLRWWEPDARVLRLLGTTAIEDWDRREDMAPTRSILGEAFLKRKPVISNDYQRDSRAGVTPPMAGITAHVAVPLLVADRAVGVLGVSSRGKRRFTEADAQVLGFLGAQVGSVIQGARLRSELVDSVSLLQQSQEVGAIGTFVAWLTPEKAGRDEWSELTMTIFGYTPETFDGRNEAFWERVHPDDIERVRQAQAVAHESGSIYDIVHRIIRPDGEVRWIHERAAVERDASGKPIRFLGVCQDITEQELASQALRDSVEQFTGAFEGSGVGMALIHPRGTYLRVNEALCAMLGYAREEMVGRHAGAFLSEADFLATVTSSRRLVRGDEDSHVADLQYKHRDGRLIWGRLHSSLIRGDDGTVKFFVSQVEDITEAMAAVAALKASEARNAAVIEATLDAMIVIDAAAMITAFNPAAERMFGYRREEVIGHEMAEMLMPERFREAHRVGVRRNVAEGAPEFTRRIELVGRRANGAEFPLELSISRLDTDGTPSFSGSIRDLSDRDRLSDSQDLLARVVAAAPVILFACDGEGTVTLSQGRALSLLGVGGTGLVAGSNVFEVLAGIPEAVEHVRRGLAGESFTGLIRLEAIDLFLEASYDPIRNDAGDVIGMVALATDVSDRVRADAARQESDAKSRLVAIVNHEVRTPLNSILGFAELLKLERVGPLNEKQARYVTNVEAAGRHLLALVNDSLDLSKIASGKMELEIARFAVGEIVEDAASQVQPLVDESGLEIELGTGEEAYWVEADRRRLLQILWNLLSNAIRHTSAGGKIRIHCHPAGKKIEIVITDTGMGIAADQLVRIFEDYTQVGVKADGTGLGLPVSRRLAQLMDGDIGVVSEVGAGSSFTITLPAAKPPPEDKP
ncbi:MAG: PAS domain S-box protein [Candidatus Dormibacteraeota bacterium]|nr:PAS domain S-box protein [Candidatus Dormibacteraeota bacterium]